MQASTKTAPLADLMETIREISERNYPGFDHASLVISPVEGSPCVVIPVFRNEEALQRRRDLAELRIQTIIEKEKAKLEKIRAKKKK